ncbi:unnamed protein product [Owenia fusiformis]|uniref:Uncharacterized protein n=1 Tax=Owenia fusiformis TaxID=6347 RepID=A0A8S4PBJ2_OWEFU|nr:unnamed protein product [Owenia fusiformis]
MGHLGVMGPAGRGQLDLQQDPTGRGQWDQRQRGQQIGMDQIRYHVPGYQINGDHMNLNQIPFQAGRGLLGMATGGGQIGIGIEPRMIQPAQGIQAGMGQPMTIAPTNIWDNSRI